MSPLNTHTPPLPTPPTSCSRSGDASGNRNWRSFICARQPVASWGGGGQALTALALALALAAAGLARAPLPRPPPSLPRNKDCTIHDGAAAGLPAAGG